MEIYGQNSPEESQNEPRQFFPTSVLNFRTPLWEKICFLLLGYLGLNLISTILSFVLSAFVNAGVLSSGLANALLMFLSYGLLAGGFLLFLFLDGRKSYRTLFSGFKDKKTYLYAVIAIALVLFVNYFFSILYSLTVPDIYGASLNQSSIESEVTSSPVLMFFAVVLFAPFTEELTYRVGLVDTIGHKDKYRWLGIFASALVFGLVHFGFTYVSYYIELSSIDPAEIVTLSGAEMTVAEALELLSKVIVNEFLNFPVYFLSGFVFAFIYAKSGKITSTMTAHIVINLISFTEMLISQYANSSSQIVHLLW